MNEADAFEPIVPWLEPSEHRGVSVLLQDKAGRVLMQLRDDIPDIIAPGKWCLFGGHIDPGETILEAAIREMEEETGLVVSADELVPYVVSRSRPRTNLIFVYRMVRDITPADIRVGEGAGFAFLTREQLDRVELIPAYAPVFHRFWQEDFQS